MALQSGMDYGRSFDMAATLLENDEETKQKLMNCKEKMFEGESFSKVIRETEIYSPLQSRMIMIAERTGEADNDASYGDTFCDWIAGDELRWNRM